MIFGAQSLRGLRLPITLTATQLAPPSLQTYFSHFNTATNIHLQPLIKLTLILLK